MSQFFSIHPDNPQGRLISESARILHAGGVIVYPTDAAYALGCHMGDKDALARICRIRNIDQKHNFTLMCRDLSEIASYASFSTPVYRILKHYTPGPYTWLLVATREVPRRLMHPKKKTIGLRVPDNTITLALLEAFNEPMMTTTLILPGEDLPMNDPAEIRARLENQVELIIDGDYGALEATSLIDLTGDEPRVVREGLGDVSPFV